MLDAAYHSQILPILRELTRGLTPPNGLFIVDDEYSSILFTNPTTHDEEFSESASHLLGPRYWQDTKERHIASQGFALDNADRRLNIQYQMYFKGQDGVRVDVSVNWHFRSEELIRTVKVREELISELEMTVPYEVLTSVRIGLDEMIAKIGKRILSAL